jgi:hypothetical protein
VRKFAWVCVRFVGGASEIEAGELEGSTVDLAQEFTNPHRHAACVFGFVAHRHDDVRTRSMICFRWRINGNRRRRF